MRSTEIAEGDGLHLRVLLDAVLGSFAPDAGLLDAAERGLAAARHAVVDAHHPALDPPGHAETLSPNNGAQFKGCHIDITGCPSRGRFHSRRSDSFCRSNSFLPEISSDCETCFRVGHFGGQMQKV